MGSEVDEDEYFHDLNSEEEDNEELKSESESEDGGVTSEGEVSDSDNEADANNSTSGISAAGQGVWINSENFQPNVTQCLNEVSVLELESLDFNSSPLTVLRHIVNDELIEEIMCETNRYACQILASKPNTLKGWHEVTKEEIWSFLGLQLLMGIDKKPSYKDYWSLNPILHSPIFGKVMSRDRFLSILRALHFIDNEGQGATDHRLNKLGNFLPKIMQTFKDFIEPGEFMCIDETLLLFKGRLSFLQYIPSKRARFGIKFYVLVDCETKFVVSILPYTGKSTRIDQDLVKQLGYGGAIVSTLMENYLNENRNVVVDNFFASPILADSLISKETYLLGTVRPHRKGMPKMTSKMKKGDVEVFHTDKQMIERWCDRRNVHIISNFLRHKMKDVVSKRYFKKDGVATPGKQKPASVLLYNSTMGGVDDVDRQIQPYTTERKTTKWYRKVAFHLLDICIYNAFIVYKYIRGGIKMEYKPFLQELISEIFQKFPVPRSKVGRPVRYPNPDEERLKGSHAPVIQFTDNGTVRRLECHLCRAKGKRRLTQYKCNTCLVPLCVKPVIKKNDGTGAFVVPKSCCELYHLLKSLPSKKKTKRN